MSKTITLVIVMVSASLVTFRYADDWQQETPPVSKEVYYFNEETMERTENYRIFKGTLVATLRSLEARDMNLADATARVYATAKKHGPVYLERVAVSDPDVVIEGSVARNLIGHLRSFEGVRPTITPRAAELEIELQNLAPQLEGANLR